MLIVLRAAGLLLAVYLGICLFLFLRQREMMYFPARAAAGEMDLRARDLGMERWKGPDGTLHGWKTSDGTGVPVVIFHGNGGNALDRGELIQRLRANGVRGTVHVLDYPGFGDRSGSPNESALVTSARSALKSLQEPAVVIGESLGTGVAAQAVTPQTTRGLLLITPFDSMVNAAAHRYPWVPVRLLVQDRYDSMAALAAWNPPTVVLLAENDDTTPPDGGRRLYQALAQPKQMHVLERAGHNDVVGGLPDSEWGGALAFVGAVTRD